MTNAKKEIATQALNNAVTNTSTANYDAIFTGFMEKGIDPQDILPRENVFTYNAWQALGRQVRKGEKGVKVVTVVNTSRKDAATGETEAAKFLRTTTVFHITQTDPVKGKDEPAIEAVTEPVAAPAKTEEAPQAEVVAVKEAPQAAANPNDKYELGDVFSTSWGYEQTNVNFYQVVAKKGKSTLVFKEITGVIVSQDSSMSGKKAPKVDEFKNDKMHTCRLNKWGSVKIENHGASACDYTLVDGVKVYKGESYTSWH